MPACGTYPNGIESWIRKARGILIIAPITRSTRVRSSRPPSSRIWHRRGIGVERLRDPLAE